MSKRYLLWLQIMRISICPADGCLVIWIKLPLEELWNGKKTCLKNSFTKSNIFLLSFIFHENTGIMCYLILKIQINLECTNEMVSTIPFIYTSHLYCFSFILFLGFTITNITLGMVNINLTAELLRIIFQALSSL